MKRLDFGILIFYAGVLAYAATPWVQSYGSRALGVFVIPALLVAGGILGVVLRRPIRLLLLTLATYWSIAIGRELSFILGSTSPSTEDSLTMAASWIVVSVSVMYMVAVAGDWTRLRTFKEEETSGEE